MCFFEHAILPHTASRTLRFFADKRNYRCAFGSMTHKLLTNAHVSFARRAIMNGISKNSFNQLAESKFHMTNDCSLNAKGTNERFRIHSFPSHSSLVFKIRLCLHLYFPPLLFIFFLRSLSFDFYNSNYTYALCVHYKQNIKLYAGYALVFHVHYFYFSFSRSVY